MICIFAAALFAGCSSLPISQAEKTEPEKKQEEVKEDSADNTKAKKKKKTHKKDKDEWTSLEENASADTDYEAVYEPVFTEIFDIIDYGYNIDREYKYASGDLTRKIDTGEINNLLDEIGYRYEDISGDGVPELLIGYNADYLNNGGESYISAIYTIKNGKPFTSFACSDRSGYMRMDDSHFFYTGNIDANFSVMGKNHLSKDGTEIEWDDCYFKDEKEDGTVGYYHNKTGIIEAKESEKMNISDEDYYEIMDDCAYSCIMIEWTPIGSLKGGSGSGDKADAEEGSDEEGTIPQYLLYVKAPDGYANLRTGPGTEYDIICRIPNGDELEVYREDAISKTGKKWLKVAYWREADNEDGYEWLTGWIAESQLE